MVKQAYVFMLTICLLFTACDKKQEEQEQGGLAVQPIATIKTIVAIGDSLTAGYGLDESDSYPAILEQKLQAEGYNYKVINAGVSSETSSGALARIEWILTLGPDIVLLETGANDGLRGIDTTLLEDNIRKILQLLKEREVVVVLAGMQMVWNMGPIYVSKFNRIYPKLAEEFDVIFYPFFLQGVAMNQDLNLSDGMHPNAKGYAKVVDAIYPYVLSAIREREGQ